MINHLDGYTWKDCYLVEPNSLLNGLPQEKIDLILGGEAALVKLKKKKNFKN
jgi:hypothetical protein